MFFAIVRKSFLGIYIIIDPFDIQIDVHLFFPAETEIGSNKSRDLFRPIAIATCILKLTH